MTLGSPRGKIAAGEHDGAMIVAWFTTLFAAAAAAAPPTCRSDLECSYNGRCDSGACQCRAAWSGNNCQTLDLLPTDIMRTGYRSTDAKGNALTSWGGAVLQDDAGTWHMWASELLHGCAMDFWLSNSQPVKILQSTAFVN